MIDVRKARIFGESTDYLKWINENPKIPSRIGDTRTGVQDCDILIHTFMTAVDKIGTRELQLLIFHEAKTRNGEPDNSQRDTWWKINLLTNDLQRQVDNIKLWHRGVAIVSMEGTYPKQGEKLRWGRYCEDGSISYKDINPEILTSLIRGDIHPDTLQKETFRRHHKTRELAIQTIAPLGFVMFEKIVRRS